MAGGFQMIHELKTMFTGRGGYGLEFEDDFVSANHIPSKRVAEIASMGG
jgi:hypothetical protein